MAAFFVLGYYASAVLDCGGDPNNMLCKPDNDAVVFKGLPSTVCNQSCNAMIGYYTQPTGCNCQSGSYNTTRLYLQFANLSVVPDDLVLVCHLPDYNCNPKPYISLYRFYDNDWNENTLSWDNQPITCDDGNTNECYNTDFIESNYDSCTGHNLYGCGGYYSWNLTQHNIYKGLQDIDPLNINIMVRWNNISSASSEYFGLYPLGVFNCYNTQIGYCWLDTAGIEQNATVLNVRPLVNGNLQDNVRVCITTGVNESCGVGCYVDSYTCKYTTNGIATFTFAYGNYPVNASYCGVSYYYPSVAFNRPVINLYPILPVTNPSCLPSYLVGSIYGTVYYANNTPAGVSVISLKKSGETNTSYYPSDSNGFYNISNIATADYSIWATKGPLNSTPAPVHCVAGGNEQDLHLGLPPTGFAYTFVNISTVYDVTPLGGVNVDFWFGCVESCFANSSCRNSDCLTYSPYDRVTNSSGFASINSSTSYMYDDFYLLGYRIGYTDDWAHVQVTGNYTPVTLNLGTNDLITVNIQESNNLSGVKVRLIPSPSTLNPAYTDANGFVSFNFTQPFSPLTLNASLTNYWNNNVQYGSSELVGLVIDKTITMIPKNNTFSVMGYCLDSNGSAVNQPVNLTLKCHSCQIYNPQGICSSVLTNANGQYVFPNTIYSLETCNIYAIPASPNSPYTPTYNPNQFTPNLGVVYFNLSQCVKLTNSTPAGTIKIQSEVIEDIGRSNYGLDINSGTFYYSVNGSYSSPTKPFYNGIIYIDNLVPLSNITLTISAQDYTTRTFNFRLGNNDYTGSFALVFTGSANSEESSQVSSQASSQASSIATSKVSSSHASSLGSTTSTPMFHIPSNLSIYTPSNETSNIIINAYDLIIGVLTAVCGALLSLITVIIGFVFIVIILFANKVLNALGWKWKWFGLGD